MYATIVILTVLASILMCLIVMIQESKGGGLAADYSNNNQILGAPKTTNFIEKTTWSLAIAMIFLSVICVAFQPTVATNDSVLINTPIETNPNNIPGMMQPSATDQAQPATGTTPAPQTGHEGHNHP